MPHELLCTIAELPRYGISYELLQALAPQPIEVAVLEGGALGTMAYGWRLRGDANYSLPIYSESGTNWVSRVEPAYAILTFPAGTYTTAMSWIVDTAGNVTVAGGGLAVTATRFDVRQEQLQAATDEAIRRMKPRIVPPLLSWSAEIRRMVGCIAVYELKSIRGLAPTSAAIGDENVYLRAQQARGTLDRIGRSQEEPGEYTDSSASGSVAAPPAAPQSDDPTGW